MATSTCRLIQVNPSPPLAVAPIFFLTQPRPRGFFYQIPLWQNIQVTVTSPGPSRFHQVQKGPTRCHQVPKKGSTRFQPLGCFTQCLLALEEAEALVEKGDKSTPNLRTTKTVDVEVEGKVEKLEIVCQRSENLKAEIILELNTVHD